jgi:cystine transport system substrate-binding protein
MLYEQGNVEPLEIVFGAKNLDEALSSLDNLSRVTGQSEDVLRQLKTARVQLAATSSKLAARQRALTSARQQAQAQAAALAQTRAARASYISSLAARRRLNESQISSLVAAAQVAQARTERLATAAEASPPASASGSASLASATVAPPAPVAGAHELTVTATGYALSGTTATGLPVGWGVVAVDPSIIPLGTHMTIPGYGEAVAADTGGSVAGATIDLWFPSTAQANAWGRRTVTIVLH